ncbi:TerB family tellurite resistance protein [Salinimicrobium sp. MT39]|jgi:uncharacterized tellurite resistance protein B-like protein|uniref:TerB family tellurite resistance protein n=1 Tax=Salinimicrobium profundisediminis TaxID=2994553 RepID=A0A9X3CXW1_9FLAO|nr:TerB family tellurite resistance protein [Salinimicrobium profundisediminis]MCX2838768.1 TerB family tellurite resistance protein [Salinimicrobium profundisediminis]
MSFSDLFGTGEHLRNLGHFAAIVNLAAADGPINAKEEAQLKRFATKLDIAEEEYMKVLQNPNAFPIHPNNSVEGRLERLYDLFKIIYSDHDIEEQEVGLLKKYAIGIGFSQKAAQDIIKRSMEIFSGMSFDDYRYLLNREK